VFKYDYEHVALQNRMGWRSVIRFLAEVMSGCPFSLMFLLAWELTQLHFQCKSGGGGYNPERESALALNLVLL
jgi:hypothetical protein